MTDPWLSVVMPVFNGARTLERTLRSLCAQSPGFEVIAVDQASSDGSKDILLSFAHGLPLRILSADAGSNWMHNTNLALNAALAPMATMLHQDDVWLPGRAAALKQMAVDHPSASLWVHGAHFIDEHDRVIGRSAPPFGRKPALLDGQKCLAHLLVQNTIALPAAMFRTRDALDAGGLDETLWYTADWDLWLKLVGRGQVSWNPCDLAAFRIHAHSLTLTGSRDDPTAFHAQLDEPVDRHVSTLAPANGRDRIERMARLSNRLNAALARSFHGSSRDLWAVAGRWLMLGPRGWYDFLRDTNILGRTLPRLRLIMNRE